jgi:hypothetical protein
MISDNPISVHHVSTKIFFDSTPEKWNSTNSNGISTTFDFAAHSSNLLLFQQIMGSPDFVINYH